jgi:hypothetical protein
MELDKPIIIRREETNRIATSSGEFLEYISWKQCKELGFGIGVHRSRFPKEGYIVSNKVNEIIFLLKGSGNIVVQKKGAEERLRLEKEAIAFIPKKTPFFFEPTPSMEILSATGPAWYPKQQSGLDYRRKESGRMIL